MILKEQKFNNLEVQAIANYKDLLLPRFPNGNMCFYRINIESKNDFLSLLTSRRHRSEIINKLLTNNSFSTFFESHSINTLLLEVKRERVKYSLDGFQLIANLAKRLFSGGSYFSTLERLDIFKGQKLSPKECFHEAQTLVDILFGEGYNEFSVLELEGVKWNDWFLEEYLSDSYFVFNKSNNTITVIAIRDSD